MRVLLADFDVFSSTGGGQTFYRRVIERHPGCRVLYPSRGFDLRRKGTLPENAEPFSLDRDGLDGGLLQTFSARQHPPVVVEHMDTLCSIARACQGDYFDVVEVPSFRPYAHLVRGTFAEHGIRVGSVSLGMLGWLTTSLRKGLPTVVSDELLAHLEMMESESVAAADARYTISELHANENKFHGADVGLVDMIDALEAFPVPPPQPPGEGPPDLWYVGRLDAAKGPDLFLEIVARVPRAAYRRARITGPDSYWSKPGERWSDDLIARARDLQLDITYHGLMSDQSLRDEVYGGRSVVVIPSRTDSFNLVALEALANGCPVLLSRNTGAAEFISTRLPAIAPPVMDPEQVEGAAAQLGAMLTEYPTRSAALRRALREHPIPRARNGFMSAFWRGAPSGVAAPSSHGPLEAIRAAAPLLRRNATRWRPFPAGRHDGGTTVVVVMGDPSANLGATLAGLARQTVRPQETLVVCDRVASASVAESAVAGHEMDVRLIVQGQRDLCEALNRGCGAARTSRLLLLIAGDLLSPDCIADVGVARVGQQAEAVAIPWEWLHQNGQTTLPDKDEAARYGFAMLVARRELVAAGGFVGASDSATVTVPSGLHCVQVAGALPRLWRLRSQMAV